MLPLLQQEWHYPYILGVGPSLILPVALTIKLFGFSVAAARIPMVIYLIGTCICFYFFTRRVAGKPAAFWATLLLVTLSAFVNTGKPVLGEVPGLFFLFLGLLCLLRLKDGLRWTLLAGMLFGLAVLTKITYGLLYPALGIAGITALLRRDMKSFWNLFLIGSIALIPFAAWNWLEMSQRSGVLHEILFLFGENEAEAAAPFTHLLSDPRILLRLPFLTYGTFFVFGLFGALKLSKTTDKNVLAIVLSLILLFTLYFVSSFGWYRHLLPAHSLLLPFVPAGARSLLGKKIAILFLIAAAVAQGLWQLDHRGASRSKAPEHVTEFVEQNFAGNPVIVQQAEIFVRVPRRHNVLFLTNPLITARLPEDLSTLTPLQKCMPVIRRLGPDEEKQFFGRLLTLSGSYFLIDPPPECRR